MPEAEWGRELYPGCSRLGWIPSLCECGGCLVQGLSALSY